MGVWWVGIRRPEIRGRVFRPLLNVNFRWVCSEIEAVGGRICVRFAASLQALFLTQYRQDLPFCGTQMESPKFSFGACGATAKYIKVFLPRLRRADEIAKNFRRRLRRAEQIAKTFRRRLWSVEKIARIFRRRLRRAEEVAKSFRRRLWSVEEIGKTFRRRLRRAEEIAKIFRIAKIFHSPAHRWNR